MKYVGAHVSISGGVENAPLNAHKIGAVAFALFTKNQRQWYGKPYSLQNIGDFKNNLEKTGIQTKHILPHDSYLINIGNYDSEKRDKSLNALLDEVGRVEQLGLCLLNFHPGSHLKLITEQQCLDLISDGINKIISKTKVCKLVMETTAGMGTNVGYKFEHLKYIIDKIEYKDRVGVCIDTCHIFAAGYDIRTEEKYEETMNNFDRIIGFNYLYGVHLNDSKIDFNSKKDRHDSIGKGKLGLNPFGFIMNDSRFDDIPLILETIDASLWAEEIKMLYEIQN